VQPDGVVVNSQAFDQDSCFEQRIKQFCVEQLSAKFSVEGFNESVLPRTAWFDEQSFDANVL